MIDLTTLSRAPLFMEVPAAAIAELAGHFRPREVATGDYVFRAGDAADQAYLVVAGEAVARTSDTGEEIEHLSSGACFGEIGLLNSSARRALEVQATSPLTLLGFDLQLPIAHPDARRAFFRNIAREVALRLLTSTRRQAHHTLPPTVEPAPQPWRSSLLFHALPQSDIDLLIQKACPMHYPPGATIVRENAFGGPALYLVRDGSGGVCLGEHLIDYVGPGDVIGELGFITGAARSATVRARTDLNVLAIPLASIERSIAPEIYRNLAMCLVTRLRVRDSWM